MEDPLLGADDSDWLRHLEHQLEVALYSAYIKARKDGKRRTYDEHDFELNVFDNLKILQTDILAKTYAPSRSSAHIIYNPVIREIFAAPFRDRVVHHLLFDAVYDWWDRHFIYDSYACRAKKGTLFGIKRLDYHIRSVSHNYARPAYVLKLDLQGYFMSLPRRALYERTLWGLDQQFANKQETPKYQILKFLWRQTIMDDPVKNALRQGDLSGWDKLPPSKSLFAQPPGKGIVIGNLTSQLLSNIYLDQLDRFITIDLGYKHYGRYVDDFFIVVTESELPQLKRDIHAIENFLMGLQLTLHPHKRILRDTKQGIPFLGATIYHNRIIPGHRLMHNTYRAFYEVSSGMRDLTTVPSYLGHMKHFNSFTAIQKIFKHVGWEYNPDDLFRTPAQRVKPQHG